MIEAAIFQQGRQKVTGSFFFIMEKVGLLNCNTPLNNGMAESAYFYSFSLSFSLFPSMSIKTTDSLK